MCYNFVMKQRFLILTAIFLIFTLFFPLSAEEEQHSESEISLSRPPFRPPRMPRERFMNYNGRKIPRSSEEFSVIGIKTSEVLDHIVLSVYFNAPVDTNSVLPDNIFVNEKKISPFTEFLFNKNHKMLRFTIKKELLEMQKDNFSLKILNLRSFDGRPMKILQLPELKTEEFYKKSESEESCQKS